MYMLEQVVSFSIERSPEIEKKYQKEGKSFEGFLRQAVKEVYDRLEKPFRKEHLLMECGPVNAASIKYNTHDAPKRDPQVLEIPILGDPKDKVSYSMRINVSDGCMLSGHPEGDWPGTIYLGIDTEHSDFGQYKNIDLTSIFLNLPVLPLAEKVAFHLLHQKIPFALRFFDDQDSMMQELTHIYKPRKE